MTFPQQNLLCLYRYDPLDRLISHTQSQASPLQRFYCKSRLATEIQGALQHSIVQHDDLLLAQQQRQDDVLDTTLLATGLQRSILQTLKANQPRHAIAYSPYGHRHPENGLLSLLGFNGERSDPVTGRYLLGNGYRAFSPVLMRFNGPDSLSPFGKGGLNSYSYCLGDPTNRYDPNGHVSRSFIASIFLHWKNKAVSNLTRNKLEVGYVKLVGKVDANIGVPGSSYYTLNKGVTPEAGIAARNRLNQLGNRDTYLKNRTYLVDKSLAKRGHAFDSEGKLVGLDPNLYSYIDATGQMGGGLAYDSRKLNNAVHGKFDQNVPQHKWPSVAAAKAFRDRLRNITGVLVEKLNGEVSNIRATYFNK